MPDVRLFHPDTVLGAALGLCALVAVFVGAEYHRAATRESPLGAEAGFPLDDAWIHLVYARSLAEGHLPSYNPGEPEAGQSSPLWGLLLAPVEAVARASDLPVGRAVRVFGLLVWIACALTAAWVVLGVKTPGVRFGAFAAALTVTLDPAAAFASASGMEPLLLALLWLAALGGWLRGRTVLAGCAAGLAVLARPEGLVAAPLLAAAAACGRRWRRALALLAPAALAAGAWMVFCEVVARRPLPNTFYVKAHVRAPLEASADALSLLGHTLATAPLAHAGVGYFFLALGVVTLLFRAGPLHALLAVALPALFAVGVAATRPMPDPDAFYWSRYLVPLTPWFAAVFGLGLAPVGALLADWIRVEPGRHATAEDPASAQATGDPPRRDDPVVERPVSAGVVPVPILGVILLALAVVPFLDAPRRLEASIERYAANVRDVDRLNARAGRLLGRPDLPRGLLVASQDAGAVRYLSGRPVLDLLGLNDHRLVSEALAGRSVASYLDERRPDVICLLDPDPGAAAFARYALSRGYRPAARFETQSYSLFGGGSKAFVVWAAPALADRIAAAAAADPSADPSEGSSRIERRSGAWLNRRATAPEGVRPRPLRGRRRSGRTPRSPGR